MRAQRTKVICLLVQLASCHVACTATSVAWAGGLHTLRRQGGLLMGECCRQQFEDVPVQATLQLGLLILQGLII